MARAEVVTRAVIVHPRFAHNDPPVPAPPPPAPHWLDLPLEVLDILASHLEKAEDVLALAAVCKGTRHLATCPVLWRRLCHRCFGVPAPEELGLACDPAAAEPRFWVQLFRDHRLAFLGMLRSPDRPGPARLGAGLAQGPMLIQLQ